MPNAFNDDFRQCSTQNLLNGFNRISGHITDRFGRSELPAHGQSGFQHVDPDDVSRSHVSESHVEELPHRPLPDNDHVPVDHVGKFLQREDRRTKRLSQHALLFGHSIVQADGSRFFDDKSLTQSELIVRHAQNPLPHLEPAAVGRDDSAGHLVQRMAQFDRPFISPSKKRKIRSTQAGAFGLEDNLSGRARFDWRCRQNRFRYVDKFDPSRADELSCQHDSVS